jgi:hypothetical protein
MIAGNCFIMFTGRVVINFLTMAHHNSPLNSLSPEMHSINAKVDESSTGRIWAAGCHRGMTRSRLAHV